ncbi:hypothetical protein PV328_011753 [Microctonus aethiopoides]|uniref:Uncharacterized protein n=1 Tax=Microctonus aethiopoides TaxID=144406 RepID=A0AA39C419_9HYME|nr:hypothetical protein PV328_011753 [Microctonus aethiopoides]
MCKNVPDASETDGFLNNGQRTKTETRKCYLKALITDELEHYEKLSHLLETESNSGIETDSESESQISIDEVVKEIKKEVEYHKNAHADPEIAKKLIFECAHILMWSNIFNSKFIENNIESSSSAPVESEIRKIKHGVLEKKGKLTRVDVTVEKIIDYYDGRLRILHTSDEENVQFFSHHNRNSGKEIDCAIDSLQ